MAAAAAGAAAAMVACEASSINARARGIATGSTRMNQQNVSMFAQRPRRGGNADGACNELHAYVIRNTELLHATRARCSSEMLMPLASLRRNPLPRSRTYLNVGRLGS
jgi:hypothetical protein